MKVVIMVKDGNVAFVGTSASQMEVIVVDKDLPEDEQVWKGEADSTDMDDKDIAELVQVN